MWQYCVVTIVLVFAVGYAVWRIRQNLRNESPCCGCEGCEMCKEMKKHGCKDKKECQKFGCSEIN
jgi:hypothetical protein